MSDKEEKVYLSPLKFAKPPTSTNVTISTLCRSPRANHTTTQGTSAQPNPNQTQPNFNTASPGFGRSKLYEILTTETMSDDLTPSAAIWEQYQEEAREHDDELVKGRNGNLDQMLLFVSIAVSGFCDTWLSACNYRRHCSQRFSPPFSSSRRAFSSRIPLTYLLLFFSRSPNHSSASSRVPHS